MNADVFSSSIFVKRATHIVQEIASLADAIEFLDEWPEVRRDLIHETALRVCYDAHDGHKPVSTARNAFVGFSERAGILVDSTPAMKSIASAHSSRGKAQG
ncbi:DUF982 domain-containing protein [Mesorhizobium sp. Cs1299R1N1]|uniref:DUF982 domain-containing protein n=1 Tax=unclassified Mesorhizobium TaxID=325217 RepID=UPI00301D89F4